MRNNLLELMKRSMDIIDYAYGLKGNPYSVALASHDGKSVRLCIKSDKHETLFETKYNNGTFSLQTQECVGDFCARFQSSDIFLELFNENLVNQIASE